MENYDNFNDVLSARLKEAREKRRLTTRELADRTGFGLSAISRYENGKVDKLPVDRLAVIAEALNVSPIWLMGFDDEDYQPNENEYTLNKDERYIIDAFREADTEDRMEIMIAARTARTNIEKNNTRTNGNGTTG